MVGYLGVERVDREEMEGLGFMVGGVGGWVEAGFGLEGVFLVGARRMILGFVL